MFKCLPAEEDSEGEEGQFSQSSTDTGKDHSYKQRQSEWVKQGQTEKEAFVLFFFFFLLKKENYPQNSGVWSGESVTFPQRCHLN